jgi:hypothetical protein
MQFWMKCVWALAALAAAFALVALAGEPGGSAPTWVAVPAAPAAGPAPEYFTVEDRNRATIDYGVRHDGRAIIYNSRFAQ